MSVINSSYVKIWNRPTENDTYQLIIGNGGSITNFGGGLESFEIKVGSQNLICNFKLKIPVDTLSKIDEIKKTIKPLFSMKCNWKVELGRNGNDRVFVNSMRLFESNIEYGGSKYIEIDITLHGYLFAALNLVKIANLDLERKDLSIIKIPLSAPSRFPIPIEALTLSSILTNLLYKTKNHIIRKSKINYQAVNQLINQQIINSKSDYDEKWNFGINSSSAGPGTGAPAPPSISNVSIAPKRKNLKYYSDDENPFKNIDETFLPLFSDIDIIIVAKNENDAISAYNIIWETEIIETDDIKRAWEEKDKNRLTVEQYIQTILNNKGYQIVQYPQILNKDEDRIRLLAIPTAAFSDGKTLNEYKFRNGQLIGPWMTYSSEYGSSKNNLDLHSANNMVLSVNASTSRGQESLQSLLTSEAISKTNKNVVDERDIYNVLEDTSKQIELEIIGTPTIKYYDTIPIKFLLDVFTGNYKVVEYSHKIEGQTFKTSITAFRVSHEMGYSTSLKAFNNLRKRDFDQAEKEKKVELGWFTKLIGEERVERLKEIGDIISNTLAPNPDGQFGTEEDVRRNPKRYR